MFVGPVAAAQDDDYVEVRAEWCWHYVMQPRVDSTQMSVQCY